MRSLIVRQRLTLGGSLTLFVFLALVATGWAESDAFALIHVTVIDATGGAPQADRTSSSEAIGLPASANRRRLTTHA